MWPQDKEVYEGYGAPALGDMVSFEGTSSYESADNSENLPALDDTVILPEQSAEARSKTRTTVENLQNSFLLRLHTAAEQGDWTAFVSGLALILLDAPAIGEAVRANFGSSVVEVWEEVQPLYALFYAETYACASTGDLQRIAEGEVYQEITRLTEKLIEEINRETKVVIE